MPKSTTKPRRCKPSKPYLDFPLTVNGNGQWSKVIRGRTFYFGPWEDPDAALKLYLEQRDDLYAGRTPRQKGDSIRDLANLYLAEQEEKLKEGAIVPRTFADDKARCQFIVAHIGNLNIDNIGPQDFTHFYHQFPGTWGLTMRGKVIKQVRAIFNFAVEEGYIAHPPAFGTRFKPASRKDRKKANAQTSSRQDQTFTADEVQRLLAHCDAKRNWQLKAMILLGVNCGFGNADCGRLRDHEISNGWIRIYRQKTGEERDCPLWAETLAAIQQYVTHRKQPHPDSWLFVTKYGNCWHKDDDNKSPISQAFTRIARAVGVTGGFYKLRHTFKTVCNQADVPTLVSRRIMGHELMGIDDVYSHAIKDEQLVAAVVKVHDWLWPTEEETGKGGVQ